MSVYNSLFKILIVGDANSGKTSILNQFVKNKFDPTYLSTIGIDFNVKIIPINEENEDNIKIKLQVWDTCGQERFRSLTRSYYRNAAAIIVVYDITNKKSFENSRIWLKEIDQYIDDDVECFLVGNKCDMLHNREIEYFEGYKLADENKMDFFETSAKTDNNIETLFIHIAKKLYTNKENKKKNPGTFVNLKPRRRKKNCCFF